MPARVNLGAVSMGSSAGCTEATAGAGRSRASRLTVNGLVMAMRRSCVVAVLTLEGQMETNTPRKIVQIVTAKNSTTGELHAAYVVKDA
jgi:hypothetical protein